MDAKRRSIQAWTGGATAMLDKPPISYSTAKIICPIIMALCIAGLPTCLYFASESIEVGRHLALVFTSLALLCLFCLALRILLLPYDQKKAVSQLATDTGVRGGGGGNVYPLQNFENGRPHQQQVFYPFVERGNATGRDAHIQGEIGRW